MRNDSPAKGGAAFSLPPLAGEGAEGRFAVIPPSAVSNPPSLFPVLAPGCLARDAPWAHQRPGSAFALLPAAEIAFEVLATDVGAADGEELSLLFTRSLVGRFAFGVLGTWSVSIGWQRMFTRFYVAF